MSSTTIRQLPLPENRRTRLVRHDSGYLLRTGPYDDFDPGPWPWKQTETFRPDNRTGRHRRGEAPDPFPADLSERLREEAWSRFLDASAILAQAHVARTTRRSRERVSARSNSASRLLHRITRAVKLTLRKVNGRVLKGGPVGTDK